MKKLYLIPVMECLDIQTLTICAGSGEGNEDDPRTTGGEGSVPSLAPRHL